MCLTPAVCMMWWAVDPGFSTYPWNRWDQILLTLFVSISKDDNVSFQLLEIYSCIRVHSSGLATVLWRLEIMCIRWSQEHDWFFSKYIWRIFYQNSLEDFSSHSYRIFCLTAPYSKTNTTLLEPWDLRSKPKFASKSKRTDQCWNFITIYGG